MGAFFIPKHLRRLRDVIFTPPGTPGDVLTLQPDGETWAPGAAGGGGGGPPSGPAGGVLSGTYPNPGFAADMATQAELDAHVNDATDAHDASAISNVPAGGIAGTDVQTALNELDTEKAAVANAVMDGDAAGGVLSGTYPNPGFASDMATQAELDAHINDASDAHDASAISVVSTTLSGTGTDVQAVFEEIDNLLDDHSSRHENGGADEISVAGLSGELADAQPVTVRKNTGADVGTRSRLNFIEGTNITLTVADDAGGDEVDITIASAGGSGEALSKSITQASHGLVVGDVVRLSGTSYIKAQANTEANAEAVGIVSAVADTNTFTIQVAGRITGLSGLTAGSVYYLDDDTSGLLTSTEPTDVGDVSKPLLIADATTSGWIFNMRGFIRSNTGEEVNLVVAMEVFA